MATSIPAESERFEPADLADWHDWLAGHHADASGIWLVTPRRLPAGSDLTYENCVREALCWGWIDGQVKTLDETRALQRWARRSPRSGWSRSNKIRLAELEPTGRIQPAGRAVIEAAKASGMWAVFDSVEDLIEPPELAAALDAVPQARLHWDGFPPSARKQGLAQVALAKQPETKTRRIQLIVDKAARGERP
ncbi:MAG TPA: YdeI/OmpD-associated family protein [Microlunatus sp.]|nr:YdeI/OmpD-associated family protein [Microlunatus sp.]